MSCEENEGKPLFYSLLATSRMKMVQYLKSDISDDKES